ncbi:MAG: Na/Pi symporter, partial [Lachnospiraceae bacterium]
QMVQRIADIFAGFGVLFLGISTMSSGMSEMKTSPQIIGILSGLTNPFLAVLTGLIITAIVQSSSVTVSLTLLMAQQGLFKDANGDPNVNICLFIILGCNIGACTTALISSLAGKKDAKRAALIHLLFNIIGTVLMFIIFTVAMDPISSWLHSFSSDDGRFVANAHTIIKIFQVLILLPFSNQIVKLTNIIIPGNDQKVGYRDTFQLKYIGDKVIFNPSTAVVDGLKELERMASLASDNLNRAMNALITLDEDDIKEVHEMEENINFLNRSITAYLIKINQSPLPIEDLQGLGSLFHVANDIERIGDHAENIAEFAERRKNAGASFSDEAIAEMTEMLNLVNNLMQKSIKVIVGTESPDYIDQLSAMEDKIDDMEKKVQQNHIDRLTRQECSPEAGMIFSDVATALERVGDHAFNIAVYIIKRDNSVA